MKKGPAILRSPALKFGNAQIHRLLEDHAQADGIDERPLVEIGAAAVGEEDLIFGHPEEEGGAIQKIFHTGLGGHFPGVLDTSAAIVVTKITADERREVAQLKVPVGGHAAGGGGGGAV